ncbi:MAG: cupin domain-containing protein [Staphylothermus sp.]|nr:cupin domain-containing protein [Staphylothermus sp.]
MSGEIVLGSYGEKLGHYTLVKKEKVPEDMAEKTWIRWLIRKEDGAPNFAMRVFEVESGGHIKAHSHPWEHEIFVLEGVGDIRIGDRVYRVTSGFFIYIPPNVEHEYWNKGDKPLVFICLIPHTKQ